MAYKFRLFISLLLAGNGSYAADQTQWSFLDKDSAQNIFLIKDIANVEGDEELSWTRGQERTRTTKLSRFSNEEYSAFVYEVSPSGDLDLNFAISFGKSFDQIKSMMKLDSFRKGYSYLPEACEATHKGFVTVTDNVTGDMSGYCLTPENE